MIKKYFKKSLEILLNHWPVLVLTLIFLGLTISNYSSNTWLSGWDNLHPEFDFSLNLKRSLFASWQEYQGLGLLGGMGHAADLPRQIILWFFSLILPTSFLRYFYHFLMLYIGSLGVYFLLNHILGNSSKGKISSLSGAIFYLFNLATIQLFFVPYEAFSHHFGFLPWLFLVNLNFLESKDKKSLYFLLLANLLAAPQGYVGTFFAVYLMAWGLAGLVYLFLNKGSLKRILLSIAFIFITNAFWFLPNLYFVISQVDVTVNSKISQMTTKDNLLKNKKYGDLKNVVLLKGFWFDTTETDENGSVNYLMAPWIGHLSKPAVTFIGFLLFVLSAIGAVVSFTKLKNKNTLLFLPVFALSFIVLGSEIPGISLINKAFYKLPLFSQMFRFPFTKFSVLLSFSLSIFFGAFCYWVGSKINSKKLSPLILVLSFLPIIYLYPVFQGKLFYPRLRTNIPKNYFELFSYLKDKDGRIADFPQSSFWGWTYYHWNYTGSGFVWYGIKQPITARNFDMWSSQNENYYWEMSYALYSGNSEYFEKIFDKYQIKYVLLDRNIYNTGNYKAMGLDELEEMLSSSKFNLEKVFGNISLYRVNLKVPVEDFVFVSRNTPKISSYEWGNLDRAFLDYGIYQETGKGETSDYYYPFRTIFNARTSDDFDFEIKETEESFIFSKEIPEENLGLELKLPDFDGKELVWVNPENFGEVKYFIPVVNISGRTIEVVVPKVNGYFSGLVDPVMQAAEASNCNKFSTGKVKNEKISKTGVELLRLSATNSVNCSASFSFNHLLHKFAYLIKIENENIAGKSLLFWLENESGRRADMEFYLPKQSSEKYIIQPPMQKNGLGYSLHFDNISIGNEESVNDLGKITINPIPYSFLTGIHFQSNKSLELPEYTETETSHPNTSLYKIDVPASSSESTLVLSQSYHNGWKAYYEGSGLVKRPTFLLPLFGQEIKKHVLVNNWENGWVIPALEEETRVVVIFVPQYLEYFGLALFLATVCLVVALNRR